MIREMVRALINPASGWTPAAKEILGRTRFHLDNGAGIRAEGNGWDAFIGDLMPPLLRVVQLRDRLRICGNPHCRFVFLDLSKNRARLWCDNTGCGNRERVKRYRTDKTSADADTFDTIRDLYRQTTDLTPPPR